MKYFTKVNLLILGIFILGGFASLKKNPGFKFSKLDTSHFEIGIVDGHGFIKKPHENLIYISRLNEEKDLEIIWSDNHQEIYLLRRNKKGITHLYSVHPITGKTNQETVTVRPKSNLQAVSKQRASFQSGNAVLLFCFRTKKMEEMLPPLFINQTPESRAKIFAFYHQLEGQLINYKIDPKLREIQFKWRNLSNQITTYNQKLIPSKNILYLPD